MVKDNPKTELGIKYCNANIFFPEEIKELKINKKKLPWISGGRISFNLEEYVVEASLIEFNIPYTLSKSEDVKKELLEPAIEVIKEDIEPIKPLLEELMKLSLKGEVKGVLYFERHPYNPVFEVFDYSRDGKRTRDIFEKLMKLKDNNKFFEYFVVNHKIGSEFNEKLKKFREFYNLAISVDQRGGIPHVTGESLEEATRKALEIYNKADEIENLRFN